MMMADLTDDLVGEILSRVPATSLTRLRSTCKQWNSLFKDPKFIKKQFSKAAAAKQSMVVMLEDNRVHLMNINLQGVVDPSSKFTLKDPFCKTSQFYVSDIFYCSGLLLCTTVFKDGGKAVTRLVVWNPCLGQTRWIEPRCSHRICCSHFVLGYDGNNKSRDSYKILGVLCGNSCRQKLEIYDSNSNSWRYLDKDVAYDGFSITEHGVSLNGNAYWLGYDESEEDVRMVITFDFSTEEFRREFPPPFQFSPDDVLALSVVREEKLSLLHQSYDTLKTEIWVTTNDEDMDQNKAMFWSKFLSVDLYTSDLYFSFWVSFVIVDEEKKIVSCCYRSRKSIDYNVYTSLIGEEENGVREVVVLGESIICSPLMFGYVPSLVPI